MSVRHSLLAILDQGPCYGYQLRAEFDRRTGAAWPLNVGQIYNTLERLERDGFVVKADTDAEGHVYYAITDAGSLEVSAWLSSPVERGRSARDELAVKLSVAATLPGVDVVRVIADQRRATQERAVELARVRDGLSVDGPEDLARALVLESALAHTEAELRWMDLAEERLARHPEHAMDLALTTERPKRGRPVKEPAPAA